MGNPRLCYWSHWVLLCQVSGQQHTTLAHLEAETGNMYFKGKVGIGSMEPKSELDVRGGINIQNQRGDAVITFPKGDGSGFHIKSTDTPAQTTDSDSRFYISGKNGYTGISTTEPKAMLDVRGSMNLQDSTGGAAIYFPDKDKTGSFYIRCADDPAKYDKSQERFYVGANGMVGIGTSKPTHGLTLDTPHPLGSKQNDIAIKKGSLRLGGAIYDSSSGDKYFIDLKKNSFIKRMAVETSIGVGTKKPISMAGSSAVIHVADPVAPLVRIENSASGAAVLELQSGESKWSVTGTGGFFKISHDSKAHFTITDDGKIGVGSAKPTHGFTVASEHPVGHPANDMSIEKGNLWLGGEIKQLEKPEYSLSLDKANRVKDMSVMGKMGVGLAKDKKPKFDLELGVNKVMSLGNQMFFSSEAGSGYMSSNLFRKGEKWELSTKDAGGAVVSLKAGGEIEIAGTLKKGSPALTTMMKISAAAQTASFPMPGLKTGFGTASPEYPIHVVGATKVGDAAASIAFGESESSMGFLGANKKYVFMGTKDGQEVLSLDQATGNVGIGTTSPQSMLHIANDQGPSMSFGSAQAKDTRAYIKAETTADGVNMVMGVNNPDQGQNTLTFDFSNTVTFGGKGATVFDRGDTVFKSGNVGIGGDTFDPEYKLHVKGDAKIEGRCFVAKKRPGPPAPAAAPAAATTTDKASSPIDHLDFTDLLEEDEVDQPQYDTHIDLVDTMEKLSKVLRKQLKQMDAHDARIGALTEQLEMLTRTKH